MFAEGSHDWSFDSDETQACEACGAEPATVHLLRAQNGEVTHDHLCQACAEKVAEQTEGMALVLALPVTMRGGGAVVDVAEKASLRAGAVTPRCDICGTTLVDLEETGLVGCAACYEAFEAHIRKARGDTDGEPGGHAGKSPMRTSSDRPERREVMRLQRMLRELVECERFEEAAGVRDRLAELSRPDPGE